MKKYLTDESGMFYVESLKNATIGFRTRQICDFFVFAYGRMRAENILNIGRSFIVAAFSESATSQICVVFLKKATKMTNTIIQNLINILETEIGSIYRSARVKPATNNSMDSYFALSDKQKNRIKQLCRRHLILKTRLNQIAGE